MTHPTPSRGAHTLRIASVAAAIAALGGYAAAPFLQGTAPSATLHAAAPMAAAPPTTAPIAAEPTAPQLRSWPEALADAPAKHASEPTDEQLHPLFDLDPSGAGRDTSSQ